MSNSANIHPSAVVSPKARIGAGVTIGPFCLIHPNVEIGDNTVVESHCELGHPSALSDGSPLRIGANSLIRSHSIFYEGSSFGERLTTGHHVTVRELTRAGINLQIGTKGDIQGHCTIGDYVRTHSNVHIGHKCTVGNFVWLFPDVLFTNDPNPPSNDLVGPVVEDYAVLAAKVTLLPGVRVGRGAVIGAHSLVGSDIPPGMLAYGSTAKVVGKVSDMRLK